MAGAEKGLEEVLIQVGNRILDPPSAVEELLPLLDRAEILLSRVEQSPSESMSAALRPAMKGLTSKELLGHLDVDVKVAVASCISEITRITAPEAPYDDALMKEIFQMIVESFERLDDMQNHSYTKRVSILETVAKVRSCVVMLDLECEALILEMFHHFLKTIRDCHPGNIFSSMETIMTVVLEESEDISPDLLSYLLTSVKKGNEDTLQIAQRLAEKVIGNCALKLKSCLVETVQSLGSSLDDYCEIVALVCQEDSEQLAHSGLNMSGGHLADGCKLSVRTVSDEPPKVSGKVESEVGCSEEVGNATDNSPKSVMGNGTVVTIQTRNDDSSVKPTLSNEKIEQSDCTILDEHTTIAEDETDQVDSALDHSSKEAGDHKINSAIQSSQISDPSPVDSDKEAVESVKRSKSNSKENYSSQSEGAADKEAEAIALEAHAKITGLQVPSEKSPNNNASTISSAPSEKLPDTGRRKRGRPPGPKGLLKKVDSATVARGETDKVDSALEHGSKGVGDCKGNFVIQSSQISNPSRIDRDKEAVESVLRSKGNSRENYSSQFEGATDKEAEAIALEAHAEITELQVPSEKSPSNNASTVSSAPSEKLPNTGRRNRGRPPGPKGLLKKVDSATVAGGETNKVDYAFHHSSKIDGDHKSKSVIQSSQLSDSSRIDSDKDAVESVIRSNGNSRKNYTSQSEGATDKEAEAIALEARSKITDLHLPSEKSPNNDASTISSAPSKKLPETGRRKRGRPPGLKGSLKKVDSATVAGGESDKVDSALDHSSKEVGDCKGNFVIQSSQISDPSRIDRDKEAVQSVIRSKGNSRENYSSQCEGATDKEAEALALEAHAKITDLQVLSENSPNNNASTISSPPSEKLPDTGRRKRGRPPGPKGSLKKVDSATVAGGETDKVDYAFDHSSKDAGDHKSNSVIQSSRIYDPSQVDSDKEAVESVIRSKGKSRENYSSQSEGATALEAHAKITDLEVPSEKSPNNNASTISSAPSEKLSDTGHRKRGHLPDSKGSLKKVDSASVAGGETDKVDSALDHGSKEVGDQKGNSVIQSSQISDPSRVDSDKEAVDSVTRSKGNSKENYSSLSEGATDKEADAVALEARAKITDLEVPSEKSPINNASTISSVPSEKLPDTCRRKRGRPPGPKGSLNKVDSAAVAGGEKDKVNSALDHRSKETGDHKGYSVIPSSQISDPSQLDSDKDAVESIIRSKGNIREKYGSQSEGATDKEAEAIALEAHTKITELQVPSEKSPNNSASTISSAPSEKLPDTGRRKRGRPPGPKGSLKKGRIDSDVPVSPFGMGKSMVNEHVKNEEVPFVDVSSKKQDEGTSDLEPKALGHSGKKEPLKNVDIGRNPLTDPHSMVDLDARIDAEGKQLTRPGSKPQIEHASGGKVSGNHQLSKTKQQKCRVTSEDIATGETILKEKVSSLKTYAKGDQEENHVMETPKMKSRKKRARREEISEGPGVALEYDESLIGTRIMVWWPDDKQFYPGILDSYDPVSTRHKVLYVDGDEEDLLLKDEIFEFLTGDMEWFEDQCDSTSVAASETLRNKAEALDSSSKKLKAVTSSRGGRGSSAGKSSGGRVEPTAENGVYATKLTGGRRGSISKFGNKMDDSTPTGSGSMEMAGNQSSFGSPKAGSMLKDDLGKMPMDASPKTTTKSEDETPKAGSKTKDGKPRSGTRSKDDDAKSSSKSRYDDKFRAQKVLKGRSTITTNSDANYAAEGKTRSLKKIQMRRLHPISSILTQECQKGME